MNWIKGEYFCTWFGVLGGVLLILSIIAAINSEFVGAAVSGFIGFILLLSSLLLLKR